MSDCPRTAPLRAAPSAAVMPVSFVFGIIAQDHGGVGSELGGWKNPWRAVGASFDLLIS
jgi:hypothetical protein